MRIAEWDVRWGMLGVLAVAIVLSGGCNATPTVHTGLDQDAFSATRTPVPDVKVNLLIIAAGDKDRFDNMSMTDYWRPETPRQGYGLRWTEVALSSAQQSGTLALSEGDWKSAISKEDSPYLVILSNWPRLSVNSPGNNLSRHLIPLKGKYWSGTLTKVDVMIRPEGMEVQYDALLKEGS